MRGFLRLSAALVALALAGCMHQQQTYYIVDPATGRPVPVVQQYQAPQYTRQGYASPGNREPSPHYTDSRGLFGSSPAAAQATEELFRAYGELARA